MKIGCISDECRKDSSRWLSVLFVGECSMADKRGTGAVFEYI